MTVNLTWVTDRIAVGGAIWTTERMMEVARLGVTHVINMQIEFDDTHLGDDCGVEVLWNPVDDDFEPKPPQVLARGVDFALEALREPDTKIFIHCAAGVHRAPMMALALLRVLGFSLEEAKQMIATRRYAVDFASVYVNSVEEYVKSRG